MSSTITLAHLPSLSELFRIFLSGKHLNRVAEPALWAELEQQDAAYTQLFAALGYELRLDGRGFAWFHAADASSNIGVRSRQLALLFMVIFDFQANAGKPLLRFTDWIITRECLVEVHEQQQEVLNAEGLSLDGLIEQLTRACSLGFATAEPSGWRLLPAVCRYLDHFEALALMDQDENDHADEAVDADFSDSDADDEEGD